MDDLIARVKTFNDLPEDERHQLLAEVAMITLVQQLGRKHQQLRDAFDKSYGPGQYVKTFGSSFDGSSAEYNSYGYSESYNSEDEESSEASEIERPLTPLTQAEVTRRASAKVSNWLSRTEEPLVPNSISTFIKTESPKRKREQQADINDEDHRKMKKISLAEGRKLRSGRIIAPYKVS